MSTATMNFGNVNTDELNSNESVRNSVIETLNSTTEEFMKYFDEIMEEAGLKFEFIPGINLTTAAHVSNVLGNKNSKGLRDQINNNSDEITLHGGQLRKSSEIQELLGTSMAGVTNSGHFSLIKNGPNVSIILENGTEFKLNNGESWYLTPEAVLDLCMFMTGTEKAVAVRSAIINKLKEGQAAQKTVNKVRNRLVETLLDLNLSFDEYVLEDLVEQSFDTSSFKDKRRAKKILQKAVTKLDSRFEKVQLDLANGNIDSKEFNKLLTRINSRKQACLSVIVRISDELEEARLEMEEKLSESKFKGDPNAKTDAKKQDRTMISVTDALAKFYEINSQIKKEDQVKSKGNAASLKNAIMGVTAENIYSLLEEINVLTAKDSILSNRKVTDLYKFIRPSFKLSEGLEGFGGKVNKHGYAFLDIILSIYHGIIIPVNAPYNKNTYTKDDAKKYLVGLTINPSATESAISLEIKEEFTAYIIAKVQNNCYNNL